MFLSVTVTFIFLFQELNKREVKNVTLLLGCIHKYGKHMTIQGEDGLAAMIKDGLIQKISNSYSYFHLIPSTFNDIEFGLLQIFAVIQITNSI